MILWFRHKNRLLTFCTINVNLNVKWPFILT
uniref:Uncharacterized protein n=1 Tax=Siphoviridae sp. cteEQ43 TaxID=2827905 RepID=A0A8S5TD45_9CAUD|nr:MAG TPA: hypothetical protein [Siphoviridae sp. cteEQ43]